VFLAGRRHPAQRLRAGETGETKRAAHQFSAIRVAMLNDPRRRSRPTVRTVTLLSTPPRHLQAIIDASVTILANSDSDVLVAVPFVWQTGTTKNGHTPPISAPF
jgi:hypothetical protein